MAPFTKPGVYTLASYRGGNRVRGTGRSARGRGGIGVGGRNEDGNRVGGGNGNVNGDGNGDGAGAGTATEVEGNEEARYRNGDADVNGEGNEDGAREGGGEAKKRKKPHDSCRRNQALLFRTRHHLRRQRVALPGPRQFHSQGLVPVHAHRTERVTVSEGREGSNEVGGGIGVGGWNGDGNGDGGGGERRSARSEQGRGGNGDHRTNTRWKLGRERGRKREQ